MKRFVLVCVLAACASLPAWGQVQNTMAQRMQACVVCHGKEGRATDTGYFPRIAGKPAGYLFNQMKNFQEGRRSNPTMNHLLQYMSDDYLHAIAQYFSELDLPYPPARTDELTAAQQGLAEQLVLKGAPERQIPACVSCHGDSMAGRQPAMPGLLTLPAGYLVSQLDGWRSGERKAKAPDCMATVAKRLSAEEVTVVARWLSAQTLPVGTHPQAASSEALPIRCGSVE
jgi:cytochrome c553